HAGSEAAQAARTHRVGHQSHVGPASLVPARAPKQAGIRCTQLVCVERYRPGLCRNPHHLNDTEKSNWAWDPVAGAYYWHRFFSHQPDLNYDNPRVLAAMIQIMRRWVDLGVDGFRLDAIPYL